MSLSLNLPPELEERLREQAARAGLNPQTWPVRMLESQLVDTPPAEQGETELLMEATRGLPEPVWRRYHELIALGRAEQLTPIAHEELRELTSVVEGAHARRLEYVTDLARRLGVALREMMDELGLGKFDG